MIKQEIIRVYSEHFSSASEDLKNLNVLLSNGFTFVSSNVYVYKNGYYTDYILQTVIE